MLDKLVEILKRNRVSDFSSVDDAKHKISISVNDYLNKFSALSSRKLSEGLVKFLGNGFIFERNSCLAEHLSLPSVNKYLKHTTDFKHAKINDAIKRIIESDNVKVCVSFADKSERGLIIYYKEDEDLRDYLAPRITELKKVIYYRFKELL